MKTIMGLFGVILFMVMAGCAARDDIVILANRTSALERNQSQIRDAQEEDKSALAKKLEQNERKIESRIQPILQNQANSMTQQEALKVQIQILQGRIEALEYNQKKELANIKEQSHVSDSVTKEIKDLQARLQRLEKPPTPPPPAADSGVKAEKSKEVTPEPKEEQKETKETDKVKESAKVSPDDIFEEAQGLFQKQAYSGAKKKYEEYLKMAPKGKYLEEARFGLAESLYGTKEYEEAILTYQKLIKSHPKNKHIPEALYKQALSFLNLKDASSAKLLLEKISKNYPKSEQAKKARAKLKTL